MRLFAALTLPAPAVAHLAEAVAVIRREAPGLRWVPPERWHLTLAFFGEVDDARVAGLRRRLDQALSLPSPYGESTNPTPRLRFSAAGRFGSEVLWVGLAGDGEALGALADRVGVLTGSPDRPTDGSARRSREADLDRSYRPHLTLARAGPSEGAALRWAVAALGGYVGPDWPVESVRLVCSHRGARPRYETVATWPVPPR